MKYVCDMCGSMLSVDRDLDDDRIVSTAIDDHRTRVCAGQFEDTAPLLPRSAGLRLRTHRNDGAEASL